MPGRRTIPPGTPHTAPALSDVERAVLEGRAGGLTYMQIAARLHYTYRSTKDVGERILRKLGARDMAHAVYLACQLKILDPNQRHGDHAGFSAHIRRGEDPWTCDKGCPEGERAYRRARRAARKTTARNTA